MNRTKRRDIDETVEFGAVPRGLTRTVGLCNYQWAITGPLGAVIFYCTNAEPCDGDPHEASFGGKQTRATVRWMSAEDVRLRSAVSA